MSAQEFEASLAFVSLGTNILGELLNSDTGEFTVVTSITINSDNNNNVSYSVTNGDVSNHGLIGSINQYLTKANDGIMETEEVFNLNF